MKLDIKARVIAQTLMMRESLQKVLPVEKANPDLDALIKKLDR